MSPSERDESFETLLSYIKRNRGFDFTGYKRPSLMRRFSRRMDAVGAGSYTDYLDYLEDHPEEFDELFNTILINVTAFFRDPPAWDYIREEIVPRILERKASNEPIRVWSTGTASGEEAYSLAMVLAEQLGERAFGERVKIYATDIDDQALTTGRHGVYPLATVEPVPSELREKYFEKVNGNFSFRRDLRRSIIFGRHNLLEDPPISRIDLLTARNTLMYLSPEKQTKILDDFYFALNESGYLFLGKSELMLTRSNFFVPVDLKRRVFAPVPKASLPYGLFRAEPARVANPGDARDGDRADVGFENAPFAQLVVDADDKLWLVNVQARRLFGINQADVGRPLSDLEVSYRPVELRSQIELSRTEARIIRLADVEWRRGDERRWLEVHISPVGGPTGEALGTGITFFDVSRFKELEGRLATTNNELETAYEELQSTTEELETTNEELQSTNEELETTNEELQSTNEELETMNEELQSTNEEMETMNDEYRIRTDELAQSNGFLESVLSSLNSAVVAIDRDLGVRAWNPAAAELWGLRGDEVVGEHFLNLDIGLPVEQLSRPLRKVTETGKPEELILAATNRRGRSISCKINCTAQRNARGDVDGIIMVMEAIEA